jgi:hypothetical protein
MATDLLTAKRLRALAELYQQGQESDLMDRTLEKLLRYEAEACQAQLSQLRADLAGLEQKYNLPSDEFYASFQSGQLGDADEFYASFQSGQLGDDMDYVEWASLVQMVNNLERRIELLLAGEPA